MRKAMWVILTLVLGAIAVPCAHADGVTFTCVPTVFVPCVAAPTAPNVTFPTPTTLVITWDGQTFDITLPSGWLDTNTFIWFASNDQFIITDTSLGLSPPAEATINTNSPDVNDESGTLTFTQGTPAMPEPGTVALMLVGVGLVFVIRKRIARGLPQAA
jgi:hypothetical protein